MTTRSFIPRDCPHCHAPGTVARPSRAWRIALVAGYGLLVAMGLGMGMMGIVGPFVALPVIVLYGLGPLPFLHARASAPATCTACGTIVEPTTETASTPPLTVVPAPRAERAPVAVPPVLESALAGALVVGLGAAALLLLLVEPLSGHGFSAFELGLVTLMGGMFGVVAGSVAGASEAHTEPTAPETAQPPLDEPRPLLRSA